MAQFFEPNQEALQKEYKKDRKERVDNDTSNNVPAIFLKPGVTQLRILPPYSEKGMWFREIKEHWIQPVGACTCPRTIGEECPVCEEGTKLYEERTESSIAAARELRPRSAFLFNAVPYSGPDENLKMENGVKVLKTGVTVKRDILDLDQDEAGGWGNITSLEDGIDIRIERRGQGRMDTTYTVKGIPKRSNLLEKLQTVGLSLEDLKPFNLDKVFPPRSYDDLKALFETSKEDGFSGTQTTAPAAASKPLKVSGSTTTDGRVEVKTDSEVPDIPAPPKGE